MPALSSKGQAKEKTARRKGQVSLYKLDELSSPGSAESCRQMPVITRKKTVQTCKNQQFLSQLEWRTSTPTADHGK